MQRQSNHFNKKYHSGVKFKTGVLSKTNNTIFLKSKLQQVQECNKKSFINDMKVGPDIFIHLKKGDIYSFYSVGSTLGKGSYGIVSIVVHKRTQLTRAMKSIKKDTLFEEEYQKLFAELNILQKIDHPNIVKLYELYQDEKFYYLITEYLPGGELFDRIKSTKKFSEKDSAHIMQQVLSAISYCHQQNVVHRDIKPENIVFTNNDTFDLKMIDFGTSRKFGKNEKMTKRLGTPYYIAPEVLAKNYDEKCDIWSCGVILFIMLAGYPPFNGRNEDDIFQQIIEGKVVFQDREWSTVSSDAKSLIMRMLTLNPQERPSAVEVLADPWLSHSTNDFTLDISVLQNLQKFTANSKLKQALLTFMASQMITQKEHSNIINSFRIVDSNSDGTLSKEELINAFRGIITENGRVVENLDERILKIIEEVDINLSGRIDYTEFVMVGLQENMLLTEEKIKLAFLMFDLDGNNYISKYELQQVMQGIDDDILAEFMNEIDTDLDGKISEEEFMTIMMKKL